jgi:Carboxypeptidase regulatory-like domain/TonB dependent receptor-like, beta-barrel
MDRWKQWCAAALSLAVLGPGLAQAQTRVTGADLEGVVRDETGEVVPGVGITAVNMDTALSRTTATDTAGRYMLPAIPPGVYSVTAELFGFGGQSRANVPLLLGQSARVDFSLRLSGVTELITVSDSAPVLDARRTAVAYTVGQSQIHNLPINGRNFISFSLITPGVVQDRATSGIAGTSGLSFTGQSSRANNIMVDGFDNNDSTLGGVRGLFSQEAIREFQVLTDSFSAEFGEASGGVVNIVTRTGTNQLHGEAFAFFRNDSLNARDHFERYDVYGEPIDRPKADFGQWQWGGTLGGPLRKGQTFFFLSFERSSTEANNFVNIDEAAAASLQAAGFPVQLGNVPYATDATQMLGKIDHQWNPRSTLTVRGSLFDLTDENADPFGGSVARSAGAALLRTDWFVSASETDVLSERWLHEARFQFARFDQQSRSLDPRCDGACDLDSEGGPLLILTGVATAGRNASTPLERKQNRFQLSDTVSHFGGNHMLKAGVDFEATQTLRSTLPSYFGGAFIFNSLPGTALTVAGLPARTAPLSALEAFQHGLPAAYVQGYGQPGISYTYKELSAFVQDEWRATPKLTLRAGLRYQRQFWPVHDYSIPNLGGTRLEYQTPKDTNDFAPRLGVAFDPRGDGRTSIHAGYGLFYADHISAAGGIADIVDGADHVRVYTRVFPTSVTAWRAADHALPEQSGVPTVVALDPGLETPYSHQFSLGWDQAIGNDFAINANLLYVRGFNQLGSIDYNPVLPDLGVRRRPNDVDGRAGTSGSLLQYTGYGQNWYKGLTLALSKRFNRGSEFLLSYTLSKAEDTVLDYYSTPEVSGRGRDPLDPTGLPLGFDPGRERGPSANDQRHRVVLSGLYQLPWSLQASAVVSAGSGRPFTPRAGEDLNGDGVLSDRARTNLADPNSSVGRNSDLTEAHFSADVRLARTFKAAGGTFEAIVEVFNAFNTSNLVQPNAVFGRGAYPDQPVLDASGRSLYGRYEKALAPRQVQLALKVGF